LNINKPKPWALNGVSEEARKFVEITAYESHRKYGEAVNDIILEYQELKKYYDENYPYRYSNKPRTKVESVQTPFKHELIAIKKKPWYQIW